MAKIGRKLRIKAALASAKQHTTSFFSVALGQKWHWLGKTTNIVSSFCSSLIHSGIGWYRKIYFISSFWTSRIDCVYVRSRSVFYSDPFQNWIQIYTELKFKNGYHRKSQTQTITTWISHPHETRNQPRIYMLCLWWAGTQLFPSCALQAHMKNLQLRVSKHLTYSWAQRYGFERQECSSW